MTKRPLFLVILDGLGIEKPGPYNAFSQADCPNLSHWLNQYPHALLQASGPFVGLPEGYAGNSEVGHITIGAGRIIKQPLTVIHDAINTGNLFKNPVLTENFGKLAKSQGALHIMGLLSDGGVHSHIEHLFAFLYGAKLQGLKKVYIHAFLDGRDVPPKSAAIYLKRLDAFIKKEEVGKLVSLHGRFYAMDRDNNWERTQQSYNIIVHNKSSSFDHWQSLLDYYYAQGITDEFIPPTSLGNYQLESNDGMVCYNFRPDRMRQLTSCFINNSINTLHLPSIPIRWFLTPYPYASYLPTKNLYSYEKIQHTLKEVLNAHNKTIFSIAETEKYAHVTYFFNGEHEETLSHETRVIIPSIKNKTYANVPCMSAPLITDAVINSLNKKMHDFYLINYANADMVGHSGDLQATIAAIECLDNQLGRLFEQVINNYNGQLFITSDHGKAEIMFDEHTKQPNTAHTRSSVPFIAINQNNEGIQKILPLKQLADIAPYILKQMDLPIPLEMHYII